MANYYVNNNQQDGSGSNNEVHEEACSWLPKLSDKTHLGDFGHCYSAVKEAKIKYPTADGCMDCCPDCHQA